MAFRGKRSGFAGRWCYGIRGVHLRLHWGLEIPAASLLAVIECPGAGW